MKFRSKFRPSMIGGIEKLRQSSVSFASDWVDQFQEEAVGDSPIEKLLYTAIQTVAQIARPEYGHILTCDSVDKIASLDDRPIYNEPSLYIIPQAQIVDLWRVDFLMHARNFGREDGGKLWRKLIVECDGHDFHEKTKEQAARDRSRDRMAQEHGYQIKRFTGSEIWRDPWSCADEIFQWAAGGLF